MKEILSKNSCVGCGACANACPKCCITMEKDKEGFLYPHVDESSCIDCCRCQRVCPVLTEKIAEHSTTCAYGAHAMDENIVRQSSSGGVFTVLGRQVLSEGGVVFGAAFDNPHHVKHIAVHTVEELSRLQGSKYVQSEIGMTYQQAEKCLKQDKWVLFSGMPCQIAGLKSYLGKEYEKLLCVDTICHSTPSPKVWDVFLREIENELESHVIWANFREKKDGWEHYNLYLKFENGQEKRYAGSKNVYMRAFIQGLSTRNSCYTCKFKAENHHSDITLGDFWGVRDAAPICFHGQGTSLVLVQTEKGRRLLEKCRNQIVLSETSLERAIKFNPAYSVPSKSHALREEFFNALGSKPIEDIVLYCLPSVSPTKKELWRECVRNSFPIRVIRRIKRSIMR